MATHAEIFEKLKALKKSELQCIVADFLKYDNQTHTITVKLKSGLEIPGVRLKAAVDKKKDYYHVSVPREKSTVLIGQIGESSNAGEYYLINASEYETWIWQAKDSRLVVDKTGTAIRYGESLLKVTENGKLIFKIGSANLYDALKEFLDATKNISIQIIGVAGPYPLTINTAQVSGFSKLELDSAWAKLNTLLTNEE